MTAFINRFIPDAQNIDADQWLEQQIASDVTEGMAGRKMTAAQCADACRFQFAAGNNRAARAFVENQQRIVYPASKHGLLPERLRLESVDWWTRQLTKRNTRESEQARVKRGRVHRYVSDDLLTVYREARQRMRCWVERATLTDRNTGDVLDLQTVAAASQSNPENRRNELMTRIHGMESFSLCRGHSGRFITITAPGRFHANSGARYVGLSPRQVHDYLMLCWERTRADWSRNDITVYGLRVAEPHTDGCPHWHLLMWFESGKQAQVGIRMLRKHFLRVAGHEAGAVKNRVKTMSVNPYKGGAAAYIAKYVAKNVDGAYLDNHHDDGQQTASGSEGAERVRAWASAWGIRQFQFIGGPKVGPWRELRRVRDIDDVPAEMVLHWAFADSGDWYGYMIACEIAPIKTARRTFADDLAALMAKYGSAEAIPDDDILDLPTLSGYQEPSEVVMGIECDGVTLITRQPGRWKLKVAAPVEHEAEPQNRLEAYALVNYRDVEPDWDDLVGYASQVGVWGRARPQGPPALDLWQ